MKNYLGGYYLSRMQPLEYGSYCGSLIYSCSTCFNDNVLGSWAYSWITDIDAEIEEHKQNYALSDATVSEIREWVNARFEEKKIGWPCLFADLETLMEYQQKFFAHLPDLRIFALYFAENEADSLIQECNPNGGYEGVIGLAQLLADKIEEKESKNEQTIGYDVIGVEWSGDFHSFHCHDIGKELSDRFGLTINSFGLFEPCDDWTPVLDYFHDDENGCEPVPWFVVKTKLIEIR